MESSKSLKRAVLVSVLSTAASLIVTYLGKRLLSKMDSNRRHAVCDHNLNRALEDSMDCSDPVAKY
jgi:hypothetical protein